MKISCSAKRLVPIVFVAVLATMASGCAMFEKDNRRCLNILDEYIQFESTAAKICFAPVGVPLGTVTLAVDAVVVNPIAVIPQAGDDVYQIYWKPRDLDWFKKSLIFPIIVILTPPTFVGDWTLRTLLLGAKE